jgi:GNAT superfamily N-acetyltransferase
MRQMREDLPREQKHPFVIRQMTHEDMSAVISLEQAAFRNPWSPELLRRELDHDWSTILLVEDPLPGGGRELLGLAIFWIVQDEVHVLNVATAPQHRRRGVARAVMDELLGPASALLPGHPGGAPQQRGRHWPVPLSGVPLGRCPAELLRGRERGRARHGARLLVLDTGGSLPILAALFLAQL